MKHPYSTVKRRHWLQWLYASVTIVVLALGWRFPALGFVVVGAMLGGLIFGPVAGRWFCGNLCPRGGFLERVISRYSPGKPIPLFLRSFKVRLGVVVFLVIMVSVNGSRDPSSWQHWGLVFWTICFVTSVAGAVMAAFWSPRTWCAVCPMGSMQRCLGGGLYPLALDWSKCKRCRLCEKKCPMKLEIIDISADGRTVKFINSKDCIKCGECVAACPAQALRFNDRKGDSGGAPAQN